MNKRTNPRLIALFVLLGLGAAGILTAWAQGTPGPVTAMSQRLSRDGGVDWPTEAKITQSISLTVKTDGGWPVQITNQLGIGFDGGLVTANQGGAPWSVTIPINPVADGGMVNVGNFPASQACTIPINPVADGGMVNVGNFPATQAVSVPINPVADGGMVNIGNLPATQAVSSVLLHKLNGEPSFAGVVSPHADGGTVAFIDAGLVTLQVNCEDATFQVVGGSGAAAADNGVFIAARQSWWYDLIAIPFVAVRNVDGGSTNCKSWVMN
jgi:hypothetical protein